MSRSSLNKAGCTALQRAAAEGHVDVVKQLIKHGANVNIQDKVHGNTALHEASWKGYSKCVEALCQASKINLHVKNAGGFAPLHLACQNGHNQSCRELLMANCNPDLQNNYGDTPLHTSARYGHAGVTRILISADCQMSDQNKNGDTALHITAAMGRRKLTRILLEAGCDPNRRNKQNERAKDIAARKDLIEIIEIIDKTVPIKKKEKQKDKDKKDKENEIKSKEKKRSKESGSSKDSSTRPKEKKKPKNEHQVHFETPVEAKWSPYGCHYYPDSKTFPKPRLDSLPHEPLKKGEQYYLDLAGNIRKGPVGVGYTCYCAPFFRHMEERLDRDKKELKDHIDAAQIRLDKKVTNLEVKTRSQLNEITRSMALERAKCQQRHLHLEQWLIRGSLFRNTERPKQSDRSQVRIVKSRSLENILEEKPQGNDGNLHRSVDILNERFDDMGNDDLKNRSSSREGKESGKGSSEVGDLASSEAEDIIDGVDPKRLKETNFAKRIEDTNRHERKMRRTTREISERIDQILKNAETADSMGIIYDEMLKWRSYHNAYNKRNEIPERKADKENQRVHQEKQTSPHREEQDESERLQNRHSYHKILRDESQKADLTSNERRMRRLSDPRGVIEEPERKSVQEIVSKLQKQHTVQELVEKIQRKTGLIHKSAQKWKENKLKNKDKSVKSVDEKKKSLEEKKDEPNSGETESEKTDNKVPHNYENIRQWDVPQEKLSQLPYRCRNTVYSPSPTRSLYGNDEYQRNYYKPTSGQEFTRNFGSDSRSSNHDIQYNCKFTPENEYEAREYHVERDDYASAVDVGNDLYGYGRSSGGVYDRDDMRMAIDPRKMLRNGDVHNYSPTQNDSGYSTKPYGGSSTGPSPSLSGQDIDCRSTEMKPPPYLPHNLKKLLEGRTSSLV
ncbi:hypothetical protein RUM44_010491 [Polyplax serrata]|uniref:Ankyrin repeat domain-containing protein 6 n=1 Tax=Polyplax serrata TaxID=468196 RepID=A0ABR1AVN8_POLSC